MFYSFPVLAWKRKSIFLSHCFCFMNTVRIEKNNLVLIAGFLVIYFTDSACLFDNNYIFISCLQILQCNSVRTLHETCQYYKWLLNKFMTAQLTFFLVFVHLLNHWGERKHIIPVDREFQLLGYYTFSRFWLLHLF